MPRISDDFADVAIYLYQTPQHAEEGSEIGGSGFLVGVPVADQPGRSWVLAVTNRHVVEQGAAVVRVNNRSGSTAVFDIPEREWIFHPADQDIAVVPLRVREEFQRYRFVPSATGFFLREHISSRDIGLGTDAFLVGRFIGRDGGQTNNPTVRFGQVAQMPTLISNEYGKKQESYLVETRSIGGYSGSPVFAYKPPFQMKIGSDGMGAAVDTSHWGPGLLGIDWGHTGQVETVFDASGRELEMYVQANTGLSMVIPAWHLHDLVMSEPVQRRLTPESNAALFQGGADFTLDPELRILPKS